MFKYSKFSMWTKIKDKAIILTELYWTIFDLFRTIIIIFFKPDL